ncbi:MATE family efflux transporter [Acidaminobacter sp. JC074]|uniref:MATE family efflux transporter n=1 Tax=Acidaminobacter sp. JC074 TaxID=2530199 RepID=UPI001F113090|nr:MATE family efflux transporter [Acidaminobacter sp. JC074]MCH4887624.1 MATE family efflux transporter [Acidaminobacter sp. JC074]
MTNKMGTMPIPKLIMTMSLPAIISMMVQALYNFVDSLFVAQIGEEALKAVSLAFPIQLILISAFVGLGIGINSSVSRKLGEGDYKTAVNIAEHGYLLAFVLYIFVAILGVFFVDDFFSWFTKDPVVLSYGITYARIILIFSFGRILAQAGMSILQGSGEMKKPMVAQLIGAITNIVLDPIMIFGLFGFPKMGVAGAAIATVTAQFISMIYVFIVLFKGKNYIKLDLKNFKYQSSITKKILLVGLPAAIMQGLVAVMLTVLNKTLSNIDETAVAVLGIYYRLQSLVFMPVFGISQGTMPVIGYNFGAKNRDRLTGALKFSGLLAFSYMMLGFIVFQVFTEGLLMMFNSTPAMLSIGMVAFRRISLMFPLVAINIVISTSFQGMGKAHYSMIVTFLRQIIILLPLASFLGNTYSLDALWYAFVVAEFLGLLLALYYYQSVYRQTLYKWDAVEV